ncbi:MAG: DUF3486 family protein [Pseudomonadota bacterium]
MPRRSKVEQLPAECKAWLDQQLVGNSFSDYEALSAALAERGYTISKSAVHRHGQFLKRQQEGLRALTESAKAFVSVAKDDEGSVTQMLLALTQQKLFELMQELEGINVEPKVIAQITRAIADISRSTVQTKRFAQEVERKTAAAAQQAERIAKRGGLSDDSVKAIRASILGIAE